MNGIDIAFYNSGNAVMRFSLGTLSILVSQNASSITNTNGQSLKSNPNCRQTVGCGAVVSGGVCLEEDFGQTMMELAMKVRIKFQNMVL